MTRNFTDKQEARQAVWDRIEQEKLGAFPFPPHGRIPNFKGARQAAVRLFDHEPWKSATNLKINPDAPQRPVREEALRRGITVFVPTPRLKGGFKRFDPARIPDDHIREAASLSKGERWAQDVALEDLPQMDAIVCGSVAVSPAGRRCGKGEGYSDIEFAILRELGHAPVPVATTVHDVQLVAALPAGPNDLPLSLVVTPTQSVVIEAPPPAPTRIDWDGLGPEALAEMPILKDLKARRG